MRSNSRRLSHSCSLIYLDAAVLGVAHVAEILPALQRSQNKSQAQNDAKAEVDHQTLTYLAELQDEQMTELKSIREILHNLKNT